MLYNWNDNTFRWMKEASEYTGYDKELASVLLPYLSGCKSLCDLGCGMAFIDFELASHFQKISCVDISSELIRNVNQRIQTQRISNMEAVCSDSFEFLEKIGEKSFDAIMALFFGDAEKCIDRYLAYARKKYILVVHASAYGTTGPEKYRIRKCCDIDHTKELLKERGLNYQFQEMSLEFGQPHRNFEEAVAYTKAFTKNVPEDELRDYVKEHITETGRVDFPFYTPKQRSFGIFAVEV